MSYCNLHVHSEYSFLDGMNRVSEMVKRAREMGQTALAITDHGYMSGIIKFYEECFKDKDENKQPITPIKPILGVEAYVCADRMLKDKEHKDYNHLLLLAKNNTGLKNLIRICSDSHTVGFYAKPRTDHSVLKKYGEGIICSSACWSGEIPELLRDDKIDDAIALVQYYKDIFDDFYLEIQAGDTFQQQEMNDQVIKLARLTNTELIITNDSHYTYKGDGPDHEVLLAIQTAKAMTDENRMKLDSYTYWLKSEEETKEYLMKNVTIDITEEEVQHWLDNSQKIADMCNVEIKFGEWKHVHIDVPEGYNNDTWLEKITKDGFTNFLFNNTDINTQVYEDRINYEIGVMKDAEFTGYMLMVEDYVRWAKEAGIPVGPGRGSAAGSLVARLIDITKVDPIKYDLAFERFYIPGRKGFPDVDMDFGKIRRHEVMEYLSHKYGEDKVAHIGTFGKMKARSSIKDVARTIGIPIQEADRISKTIPEDMSDDESDNKIEVTLANALEESEELRKYKEIYPELFRLAEKFEGLVRHTSSHAAGVVISPISLDGEIPLQRAKNEEDLLPVCQFDMGDVEKLGYIKVDILGIESLDTIHDTLELIPEEIDLDAQDKDDPAVYEMIRKLETLGIFQLCTNTAKQEINRCKPFKFSDIVDIIALGRPGPMKTHQDIDYADRKLGMKPVTYLHDSLIPVLSKTYGVMLYQEQLMSLSRVIAGFTVPESDKLRKGTAKKLVAVLAELEARFKEGCAEVGAITEEQAIKLWEDILRYASYSFNLSHSVSYCFITYYMAWLKRYYPLEFMAATLTTEYRGTGKNKDVDILSAIQETKNYKYKILHPDINKSGAKFKVEDGAIRFGLAGLKGVGEAAVEEIVSKAPYASLAYFNERIAKKACSSKVIAVLIMSGCFDWEDPDRLALLRRYVEMNTSPRSRKGPQYIESIYLDKDHSIKVPKELTDRDKLELEKLLMGGYISAHPLDSLGLPSWKNEFPGAKVVIGGIVQSIRKTTVSKGRQAGKQMAFVTLETSEGDLRATLFPDSWEKYADKILKKSIIKIYGKMDKDGQVIVNEVTNPRMEVAEVC